MEDADLDEAVKAAAFDERPYTAGNRLE